jgi:hypothetical protein
MTKNFAVISGDRVINVIVADSKKKAEEAVNGEVIECDGSFWIDWIRVDGEWVAPVTPKETDDSEVM